MTLVIDTSFFTNLFIDTDTFHKEAKEILHKLLIKKENFFIPTLLGPELLGTIARRTNTHFAEIVEDIFSSWIGNFVFAKELSKDSMNLAIDSAIRYGLKGGDAVFVSLAKELNADLLTFDEEVKKKIKGKIKLYG